MPKYRALFHRGDERPVSITVVAEDDGELEGFLAEKLEAKLETVQTEQGPVLYPVQPRFAAFPADGGGFQMVPIDKVTLVDVEPLDG